jgi:formate hydrogenlyase subunit 6/NADH:ubiquinone oxidoreductase subunit I
MIRPLIVGFATTLKHFFQKKITVNYPDEKSRSSRSGAASRC